MTYNPLIWNWNQIELKMNLNQIEIKSKPNLNLKQYLPENWEKINENQIKSCVTPLYKSLRFYLKIAQK